MAGFLQLCSGVFWAVDSRGILDGHLWPRSVLPRLCAAVRQCCRRVGRERYCSCPPGWELGAGAAARPPADRGQQGGLKARSPAFGEQAQLGLLLQVEAALSASGGLSSELTLTWTAEEGPGGAGG